MCSYIYAPFFPNFSLFSTCSCMRVFTVSREIQPKPEFQTFPRVEGMSEFQAKRFSTIDFHCFLLPIDKNHLLTIFIDFDFYVTTPGGTPTLF